MNKASVIAGILILLLSYNYSTAQSSVDSLKIYDPFINHDDIRRILTTNFSILGEEYEGLIKKYSEQIEDTKKSGLKREEAGLLVQSGNIYFKVSLYEKALNNYFEALRIYDGLNDSTNAAIVKIYIGRVYYFGDLWSALENINYGSEYLLNSNDKELVAFANYALATVEKNENKAKKLFNNALEIQHEVIKEKPDDYTANERLSRYLNACGRFEEAIKVAENIDDDWLGVLYRNNLGFKLVREGRYEESLPIYLRSLDICLAKRYKTLLRNTYDNISRAYRLKGDLQKAIYYLQYQHFCEESLFREQFAAQASDAREKYNTEKKELENEFLRKEQGILEENISFKEKENLALVSAIAAISLFAGYIIISRKKIKSANQLLDQQNREITFQKEILSHLNDELTESEKNLRIAQSTAHLANWEWNLQKNTYSFSDELPLILGVDAGSLNADFRNSVGKIIHEDDKNIYSNYLPDDPSGIKTNQVEFRIQYDEKVKWIKSKIVAARDDSGKLIRVFGTMQDITENKEEEGIKIQMAAQQSFTRQLIASQEEERKRIAGELHDSIGQDILLVKNRAQLGLLSEDIEPFVKEQLNEINSSASVMLSNVREIAFNLRPAHLERLGLTETVSSAIKKIDGTSGIKFNFETDDVDGIFSDEKEINFFRIIQEGVNNIIKHSNAKNAFIRICVKGAYVLLSIEDDGKGFDIKPGIAASGGFGLNNIVNRIKILNGSFNIKSEISKGTRLELKILKEENA